ncbi:MAG TPA: M23 family metallopeptidase, partial [Flavisolibacter sp.]|nr:M23 family metallopeptidase [Flavisolibacter sp.]
AVSCGPSAPKFFRKKTLHEKYAQKLEDTGLKKTPVGSAWLAVAQAALQSPQSIELPFQFRGYFNKDKPRALGLQFTPKPGEQLIISISKKSAPLVIYADLFRRSGETFSPALSADTAQSEFRFDIEEGGEFILRLQPELFQSGEYTVSISIGPSLLFPVAGGKAKAGSFWGASRDGGQRSHEGIDIFAAKGTPAIAAAPGVISGVREGGIGGKVVWLRPRDKRVHLYYAHLDQQLVQEGQSVEEGDTLGLVGNTGNARTTPPHLHFGVYTSSGAIDPFPFVNPGVQKAASAPVRKLSDYLRLTKAQKLDGAETVKANTLLIPLGVTSSTYLAELPDGRRLEVPFSVIKTSGQPVTASQL